jgi:hypothetical protein
MLFGGHSPSRATISYLKEIAFLMVRHGRRHHEIAIEEKESLERGKAFMRLENQ